MDKEIIAIIITLILGIYLLGAGLAHYERRQMDYFFNHVKDCPNITKVVYKQG